jgi:hypothetical protein
VEEPESPRRGEAASKGFRVQEFTVQVSGVQENVDLKS